MRQINNRKLRLIAALITGCVTAVAIASVATILARVLWPEYGAAEPTKAYTLIMLAARLTAGAFAVVGAAAVTSLAATQKERAMWWLGGLFLALSLRQHLYLIGTTWPDYPAWYHFVYLAYLIPLPVLTGKIMRGAQRTATA